MPKIYGNIQNHLNKVLTETLEHSQRTDFYVGYFYLSGWKWVTDKVQLKFSSQDYIFDYF